CDQGRGAEDASDDRRRCDPDPWWCRTLQGLPAHRLLRSSAGASPGRWSRRSASRPHRANRAREARLSQVVNQRREAELDLAAVDRWLRSRVPALDGTTGLPEVTQYTGGASNWTYRLKYPSADLVLRRPPKGTKAKSSHDMAREYRVQKGLKPVFEC